MFLKQKIGKYRTWLSYSWSNITVQFSLLNINNFEIQNATFTSKINHSINWSHTIDVKNIQIGISWNYKTEASYSVPDTFDDFSLALAYSNLNTKRLPDYSRVNASLLYNYELTKRWKTQAGISVQNMLNTKNSIDRRYDLEELPIINSKLVFELADESEDPVPVYRVGSQGLPFTPDFIIRINFSVSISAKRR